MSNQYTMNENGLTYGQWYAAAHFGVQNEKGYTSRKLRKAWREGECPCDWAASMAG